MATNNEPVGICPDWIKNNIQHKWDRFSGIVCTICCMHCYLENIFRCKMYHIIKICQVPIKRNKQRNSIKWNATKNDVLNEVEDKIVNRSGVIEEQADAEYVKIKNIYNLKHSSDDENAENAENLESSIGVDNFDIHGVQELTGQLEITMDLCEACLAYLWKGSYYAVQCIFVLYYWEQIEHYIAKPTWWECNNYSKSNLINGETGGFN